MEMNPLEPLGDWLKRDVMETAALLRKELNGDSAENEACIKVYEMRQRLTPLNEIASVLGIKPGEVWRLWRKCQTVVNNKHWLAGLSARSRGIIIGLRLKSREDVLRSFKSGSLSACNLPTAPRNYGEKTRKEIARWLQGPEPMGNAISFCPHCGKEVVITNRSRLVIPN